MSDRNQNQKTVGYKNKIVLKIRVLHFRHGIMFFSLIMNNKNNIKNISIFVIPSMYTFKLNIFILII